MKKQHVEKPANLIVAKKIEMEKLRFLQQQQAKAERDLPVALKDTEASPSTMKRHDIAVGDQMDAHHSAQVISQDSSQAMTFEIEK